MSALTEKKGNVMPSYLNDTSIRIDSKTLMSKPYPIPNVDRYAVISYLPDPDPKSDKFYIRIYGLHPTVKMAEENIREAYASGYTYFDLIVVDTRSFIPFPPTRFESEKQGSELLGKIMDKHIERSKKEVTDLKTRVRESKPTTPFQNYKEMVLAQAKKLIKSVEGDDKNYIEKMEKDFREYQSYMQKQGDMKFRKEAKKMDFESLVKNPTA